MGRDPEIDRLMRETIFETFSDCLVHRDFNIVSFEFEDTQILIQFLEVCDILYSDYSIKIAKTSGHPTIQVFMRLEEGIWKTK